MEDDIRMKDVRNTRNKLIWNYFVPRTRSVEKSSTSTLLPRFRLSHAHTLMQLELSLEHKIDIHPVSQP